MFSSFPYIFLFSTTLLTGTVISISSNNWLLMWMGLELNLLSFIPMMKATSMHKSTEAVMKYFLTQACASTIIIMMMSINILPKETIFNEKFIIMMIIISLLVKLGMVPCHWWFPMVMTNLNWPMGLILLTWQKIAPMFIILNLFDMSNQTIMLSIIAMGALVGGFGGHNQTNIKPLLAFSSIGHMAWILAANMVSWTTSMIYFLTYILVATSLILFMIINNIEPTIKKMLSWNTLNPYKAMTMTTLLLSMAGMPPLLGFMPKMLTFIQLLDQKMFIMLLFLYMGTILNLSYYMNLVFHISSYPMSFKKFNYWINPINISLVILATTPILLFPIVVQ